MTIMLVDNDGSDVMMLGDLVFKCKMLENRITTLWVGVSAQGDFVFGTHTFASRKVLMALVCSSWSSLLYFFDRLFDCRQNSGKVVTSWNTW